MILYNKTSLLARTTICHPRHMDTWRFVKRVNFHDGRYMLSVSFFLSTIVDMLTMYVCCYCLPTAYIVAAQVHGTITCSDTCWQTHHVVDGWRLMLLWRRTTDSMTDLSSALTRLLAITCYSTVQQYSCVVTGAHRQGLFQEHGMAAASE